MAQSLASQAGALKESTLKLPAIFQAPQKAIEARTVAPYIVFAHPRRSDEWAKLSSKFNNIQEGDMFLIHKDGPTELPVLKIAWIGHQQYWAQANPSGEVIRTSFIEMPQPFKEHVEAVVLVYLEDRVMPANVCFRTTKCPCAKTMSDALAEASTPEWGDKSLQHKETLVCNDPYMRFFGEVTLGPSRIGKGTGMPYRTTVATINPTGISEWRMLKEWFDNEEAQKQLDDATNRFSSRIEEMRRKSQ